MRCDCSQGLAGLITLRHLNIAECVEFELSGRMVPTMSRHAGHAAPLSSTSPALNSDTVSYARRIAQGRKALIAFTGEDD